MAPPPGPPRSLGRFRLMRRIGAGGMGEVYFAQLSAAGGMTRLAAVKVLRQTEGEDSAKREAALMAEARLSALLVHPHVVQVLDAGVDQGEPWLAMEFVPGLTLAELFSLCHGAVPPWLAAKVLLDVCAAVHAVHQAVDERGRALNVVHRDITPHNVLLSWDGVVKLADFGIARSSLQVDLTRTGVVKGKLAYLSPEQASGGAVDRRSDIYALGVVLWELLSGRRLFEGMTDAEILAGVLRGEATKQAQALADAPEALARIAARALSTDAAARFDSALEMQRALETALQRSEMLVGATDIAHLLAAAAPTRVREHEQWLRDAESGTSSSDAALSPPVESTGASPTSLTNRHVGHQSARWLPALLVAAAAATWLLWQRQPSNPPLAASAAEPVSASPLAATISSAQSMVVAPPAATAQASSTASDPVIRPPKSAAPAVAAPAVAASPKPAGPAGVGALNIGASPAWASILIDGKSVGETPTVIDQLSAGSHDVEARPLGKEPGKHRRVTVIAGQSTRVDFAFE